MADGTEAAHAHRLAVTPCFFPHLPRCSPLSSRCSSFRPATNLIRMVRNYGGDTYTVASMMLLQYLVCILPMPLWLSLWQAVAG